MYDVIWDDPFNIGVEIIDRAHRRLLSIVRKMIGLAHDTEEERKRWACGEGIRYLKSNSVKHFAEEAYMRSIGYDAHKLPRDEMLSPKRFRQGSTTGSSPYSLLFETGSGYLAFCTRRP